MHSPAHLRRAYSLQSVETDSARLTNTLVCLTFARLGRTPTPRGVTHQLARGVYPPAHPRCMYTARCIVTSSPVVYVHLRVYIPQLVDCVHAPFGLYTLFSLECTHAFQLVKSTVRMCTHTPSVYTHSRASTFFHPLSCKHSPDSSRRAKYVPGK